MITKPQHVVRTMMGGGKRNPSPAPRQKDGHSVEIATIKRMTAADETFRTLHDMIVSGQLKQGDKLPSQDSLAQQFAVSRNTVREAINKLSVMGLLTSRQGIGTVVNIGSPTSYMASLSEHLLLQPATVRDFLEARVIIEKATVRLAAMRATPEDIAELEGIVAAQKEALEKANVKAFIEQDVAFHVALAKAGGNQVLGKFNETLSEFLGKFIQEVVLLPGATQNAYAFHSEIVRLIREANAEAAQQKMTEHLFDVVKNIEQSTGIEFGDAFPFEPGRS
jgi:GntR family transcriptional regulator, transcriptional repressor for pyruvate dehydrogenase complex